MSLKTADLYDQFADRVQIVAPMFGDYGGNTTFSGPIQTVKVFEDNVLVKKTLQTPGEGRVLVVDGGGSLRCALLGDMLAQLAIDNGWRGVVIYGCIRDAAEIGHMPLGVKALNTHPAKSIKRGEGAVGEPISFGGVTCTPGDYLYADADGVLLAATALAG